MIYAIDIREHICFNQTLHEKHRKVLKTAKIRSAWRDTYSIYVKLKDGQTSYSIQSDILPILPSKLRNQKRTNFILYSKTISWCSYLKYPLLAYLESLHNVYNSRIDKTYLILRHVGTLANVNLNGINHHCLKSPCSTQLHRSCIMYKK